MRYTLLVTGPVYGTQNATSAWMFAKALLEAGHQLDSVFFYQEGVTNANRFATPASDEHDLVNAWVTLSIDFGVELNICVSAAARRGIVEVSSIDTISANLHPQFNLAGLGALAQATLTCERVIQF